jgi:phage virion morphogenesis protein
LNGVTISVDTGPVLRMLQHAAERLRDMTPAMRSIGEVIINQADEAFEEGASPAGKAWKPSARVKEKGGQTLIDSARLRNSITSDASTDHVEVGTNVVYAAIHQLGGVIRPRTKKALFFGGVMRKSVTMPARPFLPDDKSIDWVEIQDAIWRHLQ